jgi:hypothetical protein
VDAARLRRRLLALNALTFAGLALLAGAVLLGLVRAVQGGEKRVLLASGGALLALALGLALARGVLGYDHLRALRTALELERGAGGGWSADPRNAAFTRLEGLAEFPAVPLARRPGLERAAACAARVARHWITVAARAAGSRWRCSPAATRTGEHRARVPVSLSVGAARAAHAAGARRWTPASSWRRCRPA